MQFTEQERQAIQIPTMTCLDIRRELRILARQVKTGTDIVEVGVWLGACTAFLAMGILDSKQEVTLHCYDRFKANASELKKAQKYGLILYDGETTKYAFENYMKPYPVKLERHVGNIKTSTWCGNKIGFYIDDASKREEYFKHSLKIFKPSFIPMVTKIALMDFFYFETTKKDCHKYQYDYITARPEEYRFIKRWGKTSSALFLYLGRKGSG